MPVNTYGGVSCFGIAVRMTPMPTDAAIQINEYPGLNGQEILALGSRGGVTEIRGILTGTTKSNLAATQAVLFAFNDGLCRVFYDSLERGWPNVIMRGLRPTAGFRSAGYPGFFWPYQVQMFHAT